MAVGQLELIEVTVGGMGSVDLEGRDVAALALFRISSDSFGDEPSVAGSGSQDDGVSGSGSHVAQVPGLVGERVSAELNLQDGVSADADDDLLLGRVLQDPGGSTDLDAEGFGLD